MTDALIATRTPIPVDVEAGKTYWWCTCGRSASQPFCDGSHKGTEFTPQRWECERNEQKWFCGCKRTGKAPFCDGSHKGLPE
jgi:CDGSH-type Zn-finger protein